jgi:hypothetical protein
MVTIMTYPDGTEHTFDFSSVLGRLSEIGEGPGSQSVSPFVTGFEYNKSGVVTRMDYANNTAQTWEFDNRKRIKQISITGPAGILEQMDYTLNGSGDILTINDNEYSYDGFDRIVGAKTLIPGITDQLKLVEKYFGTYLTAFTMACQALSIEGQIAGQSLQLLVDQLYYANYLDDAGNTLHRPYIRNSTRTAVENNAIKINNKFVDSNTGKVIEGGYNLGHKYGHEFYKYKAWAESQGLIQQQFNDLMNNPTLYQIEDPLSNMSHAFEAPANIFLGGN